MDPVLIILHVPDTAEVAVHEPALFPHGPVELRKAQYESVLRAGGTDAISSHVAEPVRPDVRSLFGGEPAPAGRASTPLDDNGTARSQSPKPRAPHDDSIVVVPDQRKNEAAQSTMQIPAATLVRDVLSEFKDLKPVYTVCEDNMLHVSFAVARATETVLKQLYRIGLGEEFGAVYIVPLDGAHPQPVASIQTKNSVEERSRMVLEKVVGQVRSAASISFDYVMLTLVAAIIAAMGLTSDNAVVVVASMLVSPLMGPILALSFGTCIRDTSLIKLGVRAEMLGLLLCFVVGLVIGLIMSPFGESLQWPTSEMSGRGTVRGLYLGIAVAIPSGLGVALSVLGNNTSSLVGVAISASLLPPAVNTGLLFAYAMVGPSLHGISPGAFWRSGGISFALTLINIACIYCVATSMFYLKRVAPLPGKTVFWKHIVPMGRRNNLTLHHHSTTAVPPNSSPSISAATQPQVAQAIQDLCSNMSANPNDTFSLAAAPSPSSHTRSVHIRHRPRPATTLSTVPASPVSPRPEYIALNEMPPDRDTAHFSQESASELKSLFDRTSVPEAMTTRAESNV